MDSKVIDNINSSLAKIEETYNSVKDSPILALALLDSSLLNQWHFLNINYREYLQHRKKESLTDLLYGRHLAYKYESLKKRFDDLFQSQISVFDNYFEQIEAYSYSPLSMHPLYFTQQEEGEILTFYKDLLRDTENALTKFTENKYDDQTFDGDDFINIEWIQFEYLPFTGYDFSCNKISSALSILYKAWLIVASYKDLLLVGQQMSYDDIKNAVVLEFKRYANRRRNQVLRDLKHKAHEFKRSEPNVWEKLLDIEECALKLAIKGDLRRSDDTDFDNYTDVARSVMESNSALMQKILQVGLDDELFNFEYSAQKHINLYHYLNGDNIALFLELVLRRNIILCQIHPNLNDEFETWLRQVQTEENETAEGRQSFIHTYNISILPDEQRHLFMKPDKFDAYCRVLNGNIKTFIDGQGNKALWDVVNFYSMLYGFFSSRISRENVAAIFVSIIPGLGEAKSLSASMAKCSFARKDKLKKYVTLPATDELKAYEENIGKWIKEIAQSEESSQ